jgi:hypothetical protein
VHTLSEKECLTDNEDERQNEPNDAYHHPDQKIRPGVEHVGWISGIDGIYQVIGTLVRIAS